MSSNLNNSITALPISPPTPPPTPLTSFLPPYCIVYDVFSDLPVQYGHWGDDTTSLTSIHSKRVLHDKLLIVAKCVAQQWVEQVVYDRYSESTLVGAAYRYHTERDRKDRKDRVMYEAFADIQAVWYVFAPFFFFFLQLATHRPLALSNVQKSPTVSVYSCLPRFMPSSKLAF